MSEAKWVFGKRDDLLIFGGSTLIAITIGFFINGFGDYLWMYVLHDQPHVYSTYFYTYTSDKFSQRFKWALILIPTLIFLASMFVVEYLSVYLLTMILSNYSIFHFVKQQCAWFFISGGKEGPKPKFESYIDKLVIYSSVAGPALLSLTGFIGKDGWRYRGDLITLPMWIENPIYIIWAISWMLYLWVQIKKYIDTKHISWGKHFHLINGMLIWVVYRLEPFPKAGVFGLLLLVFGHSTPYLFLGDRYMKSRKKEGESFWPLFGSVKFILPMIIAMTIFLSYAEVTVRGIFAQSQVMRCILLTFVFTHFTLDGFIWRRDIHPEGLSFLREKQA